MRKVILENSGWYHVLNRGANKQEIFRDEKDYFKFVQKMRELNNKSTSNYRDYLFRKTREDVIKLKPGLGYPKPGLSLESNKICYEKYYKELIKLPKLVDILCYCLNNNHYHLILKQNKDNSIEKFMHRLELSYVKYFNHKYNHSGTLYQGPYKAFQIKDENHLAQLYAYVNCNYEIHQLGNSKDWQFSSYQDYLNLRNGDLCNKEIAINLFKNNINKYQEYCEFIVKDKQEIKKWNKIAEELE